MAKESNLNTTTGLVYPGGAAVWDFEITGADGTTPLNCSSFATSLELSVTDELTGALFYTIPYTAITVGNGDGTGSKVSVATTTTDNAFKAGQPYYFTLWRTDTHNVLSEGKFSPKRVSRQ